MKSGTDYTQEYGQAQQAYLQGNYQEAANIIDHMVVEHPEEPSILLLRGHIYCYGLQQYEFAKQQYEAVLQLTDEPELVNYANNGIEQAKQLELSSGTGDFEPGDTAVMTDKEDWDVNNQNKPWEEDNIDFNDDETSDNPFASSIDVQNNLEENDYYDNPFDGTIQARGSLDWEEDNEADFNFPDNIDLEDLGEENTSFNNFAHDEDENEDEDEKTFVMKSKNNFSQSFNNNDYYNSPAEIDIDINIIDETNEDFDDLQEEIEINSFLDLQPEGMEYQSDFEADDEASETLLMNTQHSTGPDHGYYSEDHYQENLVSSALDEEANFSLEDLDSDGTDSPPKKEDFGQTIDDLADDLKFNNDFLEQFDVFNEDDLNSVPNFDMGSIDQELADSGFFTQQNENLSGQSMVNAENNGIIEDSLFTIGETDTSTATNFGPDPESVIETNVEVEQG